eukprot:2789748-Amphidinium_carterae.4
MPEQDYSGLLFVVYAFVHCAFIGELTQRLFGACGIHRCAERSGQVGVVIVARTYMGRGCFRSSEARLHS